MKRTLLAVALLAVTGVASAAPSLSWAELSEVTPNAGFDPDSGLTYGGTSFSSIPTNISLGTLSVLNATGVGYTAAKVTYTYLGKEAGFRNIFFAPTSSQQWQINVPGAPSVGDSVVKTTSTNGALDFAFEGDTGNFAINGGSWSPSASVGLIAENYSGSLGNFAYIIGYNDSYAPHNDWDDMVIGVNIAPIPEPETYAMLLAGLGLMGFVARRRKQATQA
jgi:hypothetical protein